DFEQRATAGEQWGVLLEQCVVNGGDGHLSSSCAGGEFGGGGAWTLRGFLVRLLAQYDTRDRRGDAAPDQAVEPVIVWPIRADLPFIDHAAPPLDANGIFRLEVGGERLMHPRARLIEREARAFGGIGCKPLMHEGFPEVRVVDHEARRVVFCFLDTPVG